MRRQAAESRQVGQGGHDLGAGDRGIQPDVHETIVLRVGEQGRRGGWEALSLLQCRARRRRRTACRFQLAAPDARLTSSARTPSTCCLVGDDVP